MAEPARIAGGLIPEELAPREVVAGGLDPVESVPEELTVEWRGTTSSIDNRIDKLAKKYDTNGDGKYSLNECVVRIGRTP